MEGVAMTWKFVRWIVSLPHSFSRKRRVRRKCPSLTLEMLEDRTMLSTVTWIASSDGIWDTAGNWQDDQGVHRVPGAPDDVVIGQASAFTVTVNANAQAHSLWIKDPDAIVVSTGGLLTISGGLTSDALVKVVGGVLAAGQVTVPGLTVQQNGVVEAQANELDLNVSGQITVDATSRIDVSGEGYAQGQTTAGNSGAQGPSGGSYGGLGGVYGGSTNAVYGDYTNPTDFGSGAGAVGGSHGAGGGLVRLTADTLALDGKILADGTVAIQFGVGQGAGSGGGVYVSVTTLEGTGSIQAAGGSSSSVGWLAGGGGGRIAVYAADWSGFALSNIQAQGSTGNNSSGGTGTVYLKQAGSASGTLIVDAGTGGNGATPLGLPGDSSHSFPDAVIVQGSNTHAIGASLDLTLNFRNTLSITGGASLSVSGTLTSTTTILVSGGLLAASQVVTPGLTVQQSGAVAAQGHELDLTVSGQVAVDVTSRIDVSGQGYARGQTTGGGTAGAAQGLSGGSYGGLGGAHSGPTNDVYGDYANPTNWGSGGSFISSDTTGGSGGGLVRLTAATLALDGQILANGTASSAPGAFGRFPGGAGAGGGAYVSVTTLQGAGSIQAAGGTNGVGGSDGAGGGGGRVAVYATDWSAFDLTKIQALGGVGGNVSGGAGTVYLKQTGAPQGTLIVDAGTGGNGTTPLGLPGETDHTFVDSVMIHGGATHAMAANAGETLDFQNSLTITGGGSLAVSGLFTSATTVQVVNGVLAAAQVIVPGLTVQQGGVVTAQGHKLDLTVSGLITVDATSRIDVTGKGYGLGVTSGGTTTGGASGDSGGSYGGLGGVASGQTNAAYGDYTNPTDWGSGGNNINGGYLAGSGAGGGLVRLTAQTLALDGQIVADGRNATYQGGFSHYTAAAGSGGGIYVAVTSLQGAGRMQASGASSDDEGGGGGRIAVYANDWSGFDLTKIQALGGTSGTGFALGGAGTVYLKQSGATHGTLVVNAYNGGTGDTPLALPGEAGHSFADAVVIQGTGTHATAGDTGQTLEFDNTLTFINGGAITVPGTVINNGLLDVQNGTVSLASGVLDNSGTVEVDTGALTIASAIKQVSGDTLTGGSWIVRANSALNLTGATIANNEANVTLSGPSSTFAAINGLATNGGSFSILDGREFTTAGALSNTGSITVGAGSGLTVHGNYAQSSAASINIQFGGPRASGLFGHVAVSASAALDGTLAVSLTNGYVPLKGDSFELMSYAQETGTFASIDGLYAGRVKLFDAVVSPTNVQITALINAADLAVTAITVPATGIPGQDVTITYTVHNTQDIPTAVAAWVDSVYLSASPSFNASVRLIGRLTHDGGLDATATYTQTLTASLPGVMPGNYFVIVIANSRGQLDQVGHGDNVRASTSQLSVTIPLLTPSVPSSGTIDDGQDMYYRVDLPTGPVTRITVDFAAVAGGALLAGSQYVPSQETFDQIAFDPTRRSQQLVLNGTQAGTYYFLLHGREGSIGGRQYTITVQELAFQVLSVNPTYGSNVGQATLTVQGSQLTPSTEVSLVAGDGSRRTAAIVLCQDSSTLYATFDLVGLSAGAYHVRIDDNGATDTASDTFRVAAGPPGQVSVHLTSSSVVRPYQQGIITIDYANSGGTNVPAPLLILSSDNARFQLPDQTDWTDDVIRLLAINRKGPAGILPPGYQDTITLSCLPKRFGADVLSRFSLQLFSGSDSAFPWDKLASEGTPAGAESNDWSAVVAQAQPIIGNSWNDVLSFLGEVSGTQARFTSFDALLRYVVGLYGTGFVFDNPSTSSSAPAADDVSVSCTRDVPDRAKPPLPPDANLAANGWTLVDAIGISHLWVYGQWDPNADVTIFVTHGANGYDRRFPGLGIAELQAARAQGKKVNLLYGDWSAGSSVTLPQIYAAASGFVDAMEELDNFHPYRVWAVGESYGPYVQAEMGRFFDVQGQGKLGYILAADPAAKQLLRPGTLTDLTQGAGLSVAIHTEDFYGTRSNLATYDLCMEPPLGYFKRDRHRYVDKYFLCSLAAQGDDSWLDPQQVRQKGLQKASNGRDGCVDPSDGTYTPPSNEPISQDPPLPGDFNPEDTSLVGSAELQQRTPDDPNDISGPAGFGPNSFVLTDATLPYLINFQNEPNADIPAQQVVVANQLDPNLDWTTFRVGDFTISGTTYTVPANSGSYSTRLDLTGTIGIYLDVTAGINQTTGVATWTFTSIAPSTGDLPADIYTGILPPDTKPPNGEASVSYTVRSKPQTATGSVVRAQASVVFDTNSPVITNEVSNTILAVVNQIPLSEPAGTTSPTAEKISALLGDHYSAPDKPTKPGIVVIGTTGTGTWQYSTNGKTWTSIATTVSVTSALLLPQADEVRFLPAGLVFGTDAAELVYVAWDGSAGTAGHYVKIGTTGGGSPFSANAGTLDVSLTAVQQAPVWLAKTVTLTPVLPGTADPAGETVQQAFGGVFSGDKGQAAGIAIVGTTGNAQLGAWQYQVGGGPWTNVSTASAKHALLLGGQDMIRFKPAGTGSGVATLLVRAWDGSSGTDTQTADLSKRTSIGGTTAFSATILTAKLYVNHAPSQQPPADPINLGTLTENVASKPVTVATLLKDALAIDGDRGASLGLAITTADGPGVWQYRLGGAWQAVPTTAALLLPRSASLRFQPAVDQAGTATLTWRAWDQTQGGARSAYTITDTGGPFAFSMATAMATLTVTPSQQPPGWTGSGAALTPVLPGTYSPTGSQPPGDTVAAIFGAYFADGANSANPAIAVTALTGTTNGTWQFQLAGSSTWTSFGTVSVKQARLLSAGDRIRFQPKQGFLGIATLAAFAWDGTGGSDSGTAQVHGGAFSSAALIASCLVNTAPTLT
jgi:hypothetical protein